MKNYLLLIVIFMTITLISCNNKENNTDEPAAPQRYVVMLSLDGFRWDYQELYNTPVFDSIKKIGVRAESMKPVFPTKTFVNHYSIATGLYADNHGIILNKFYASDLKRDYNKEDKSNVGQGKFYFGEPMWVTAEKQDIKTATLFWVGSEADIQGTRPDCWFKYNQQMPFTARIDTLIHWLSMPYNQRPHLIMWYYHEPDYTSHGYGPNSKETGRVVEQIDNWLADFFNKAQKLPNYDSIDFIIVSDHGMTQLSQKQQVILDNYIDTSWLTRFDGWNPDYLFDAKPQKKEELWSVLKSIPHVKVWKKSELPPRFHYGYSNRIYDYVMVADPGWSIYWSWQNKEGKGAHGYDNEFKDMHAIFYAFGPDFKKGYTQPTFPCVDVYPLVTKLLNIIPAKTDGNLEDVSEMLR